MEIQLVASDLDGTLIPEGGLIPDKILDVLQKVTTSGIALVPATGRTFSSIPPGILSIPGIRYVISSNGAVIMDLAAGRPIHQTLISSSVVTEIIRRLQKYDAYTCVYLENEVYNWKELPSYLQLYYKNLGLFQRNPQEDLADFTERNGRPAEKIFVVVNNQEEKKRIRREMGDFNDIQLTTSSLWNLEFGHRDAGKGNALRWLSGQLGIEKKHILAMGDSENDHSMLRFAGTSIAPMNATKETKEIVNQIVPSCGQCGVASYIEEYVLEN